MKNKILNYFLGFFILLIIIIPYILIYFLLKKSNQTLQLYPEIKIIDIKNKENINTNVLEEALKISSKILNKINQN